MVIFVRIAAALVLPIVVIAGCNKPTGPGRYAVSGSITLADNRPVPAGEIAFEPDSAAGNKGPASTTQIRDGKYQLPKDRGIAGGKYIVVILPFDGVAIPESPQGKPLRRAPYSERTELPAKDSIRDFQLPK
jgi:hypothetical protein